MEVNLKQPFNAAQLELLGVVGFPVCTFIVDTS